MKESQQHALEKALEEVVGGKVPPDATFSILQAVRAARKGKMSTRGGARRVWPRPLFIGLLCGVAATLAVFFWPGQKASVAPPLEVLVCKGSLAWHSADQEFPMVGKAGEELVVTPAVGDRVIADAAGPTKIDIASFGALAGSLEMSSGGKMEILNMKWQEFGIGFGTGTITVGVLVGSISWLSGGMFSNAVAGEKLQLQLQSPLTAQVSESAEREKDLIQKLAEAEAEIEDLRERSSRRPVLEKPKQPEQPAPEEPALAEFKQLAEYPGLEELFAKVDWLALGKDSMELAELHRQIMEMVAAGEQVPSELSAELQRLGGVMHKHGAGVEDSGLVEGLDFETRVRHPIIGANWMATYMNAAGHPLDEVQRRQLTDLSNRYAAEDAQRRAAYADDVSNVEKRLGEMELQDRFYVDVQSFLGREQRALMSPGEFGGRAGATLIGPDSAAWQSRVQATTFRDKKDFSVRMTDAWASSLEIEGDSKNVLRKAMDKLIADFPGDLWQKPLDNVDRYGGYEVARVRKAARLQIEFYENLKKWLPLTPKQLALLKRVKSIVVPYKKK